MESTLPRRRRSFAVIRENLFEIDRIIELDDCRTLCLEGTDCFVDGRSHDRIGSAIEISSQAAEPRWTFSVMRTIVALLLLRRRSDHDLAKQEPQVIDSSCDRTNMVHARGQREDAEWS